MPVSSFLFNDSTIPLRRGKVLGVGDLAWLVFAIDISGKVRNLRSGGSPLPREIAGYLKTKRPRSHPSPVCGRFHPVGFENVSLFGPLPFGNLRLFRNGMFSKIGTKLQITDFVFGMSSAGAPRFRAPRFPHGIRTNIDIYTDARAWPPLEKDFANRASGFGIWGFSSYAGRYANISRCGLKTKPPIG